jgi:two-component system response regulator GlrR
VSEAAKKMRQFAQLMANSSHTVLLRGESGTGKDHLAEYIHLTGKGTDRPFVPVHCSALPEALVETELFGHVRGAFTGSAGPKVGLVQKAEGGTLFLNEIDTLPYQLQSKLLRFAEGKSIRQLGDTREIEVNTRIIVGTNANLEKAMEENRFRSDLFWRISTFSHEIAPLRERKEDIPELAGYFLKIEGSSLSFSQDVMSMMKEYHWPGNVRELMATIKRAVVYARGSGEIRIEHVEPYLLARKTETAEVAQPSVSLPFEEYKMECCRRYFSSLLEKTSGNMAEAARIAQMKRNAVDYQLRKMGLEDLANHNNRRK